MAVCSHGSTTYLLSYKLAVGTFYLHHLLYYQLCPSHLLDYMALYSSKLQVQDFKDPHHHHHHLHHE